MRKLALSLCLALLFPILLVAGNNPGDYPLRIQIVRVVWHQYSTGAFVGTGQGNVTDGDSVYGFDFSYNSFNELRPTDFDARYIAKWKKEQLRLEMLAGEIGAPDKYFKFDLKTTVRDEVYVHRRDGIEVMTQGQYAAFRAKLEKSRLH